MLIRRAIADDVEFVYDCICALETQAFVFEIFKQLYEINITSPANHYLLAEDDGLPVGFASLHTQPLLHHGGWTGEIQELFVRKDYRSKGAGKLLMQEMERIGRKIGLTELEVTPHVSRAQAHQFYRQAGFTQSHLKFTRQLEKV